MPNIDIENNIEQDRWDYHNKGGDSETMTNPIIIEC